MSIELELKTPNNASNPTALEGVIRENNVAITEAFDKAFSREGGSPNYLFTDLDMNGFRIINAKTGDAASDFITRASLGYVMAGEFRVGPVSGDLEYRAPDDTLFTTLYTAKELQGPPGEDGDGIGDLLAANNLSEVQDTEIARTNLGVEIGSDVLGYDANLAGFDPSTKADLSDPRFTAYVVEIVSGSQTVTKWGRLYRTSSTVTLTLSSSIDGSVNSFHNVSGTSNTTLVPASGSQIFIAGDSTVRGSVTMAPGSLVTVVVSDVNGQKFYVSGSGIS